MSVIASSIKEKLIQAFNPSYLEVIDESHKHSGHAGAQEHIAQHGRAESHFHIIMRADCLASLPRLERHRAVMETLSEQIGCIHALRLDLS